MNIYERLWKLWTMICKMIMDGVRDPEKVADVLQAIVDEPFIMVKKCLRRLCVVKLGATDGTGSYAAAKKVFKFGLDSDFENLGIIFSGVAPETNIAVDELVFDGKFSEFLKNTPEELERRRMLGAQFLRFCWDYPNYLRQEGYTTFAILTKNDEPVIEDFSNVFVAGVDVFGRDRLGASVYHFDDDDTWLAKFRYRILYPQQ